MAKNLTPEEIAYSQFCTILGNGALSWASFSRFSKWPGLVQKAIGKMLDTKILSLEKGCEVFFIPGEYSMNFMYNGARTYFKTRTKAESYMTHIVYGSELGNRLNALTVSGKEKTPSTAQSLFEIRET